MSDVKLALVAALISVPIFGRNLQATTIARYVDGSTNYTGVAPDLAGASDVDASDLTSNGLATGDVWTRTEFGAGRDTLAGPTAGSAAASEWLFARYAEWQAATPNWTFSATADPGLSLNLTTFTFDYFMRVNSPSITTSGILTLNWDLQVNVDGGGFSSFDTGTQDLGFTTGNDPLSSVFTEVVDLGSITNAQSVVLRLDLSGSNTGSINSNGSTAFFQGLQLEANVVPEPSAMALAALGLFGLFTRRARR